MALPVGATFRNYDSSSAVGFLLEPNGVDSRLCGMIVQGDRVDIPSGAGILDKQPALPINRYQFEFVCPTRAARKALEQFFDARMGRHGPFWFPTWERNFKLAAPYSGTHLVYIESNGYQDLFALGPAFRRLIVFYGDHYQTYEVQSVTLDTPTPGVTELLVVEFDSNAGALPPHPWTESAGVYVTALRYGRFDDDALSFTTSFIGGGGICTIPIIELPDEAID